MKLLNLGCGTKTSNKTGVTNIDWSIYLRLRKIRIVRSVVPLFIRGERLERYNNLPDNILVHNLAKGIPFSSESVDFVYHSHLLEHLDRDIADKFLKEVKRVLKSGGIHRIVVPDLERICKAYFMHISACETNIDELDNHDSCIAAILEQSIRREAFGTSQQSSFRRHIENLTLGDARRRGETHQWMYDRFNLKAKLINSGYREILVQKYDTSLIPKWMDYKLDVDENCYQYKPGSLYMEAIK